MGYPRTMTSGNRNAAAYVCTITLFIALCATSWAEEPGCPAGHGGEGCVPCAKGFFSEDGDMHCTACPPGMTTLEEGSVSSRSCGCPQVEGYKFFSNMEMQGNDIVRVETYEHLSDLAKKCDGMLESDHCVAFTTHGVLKSDTTRMSRYPMGPCSGTYVREDSCVVPPGTKFYPGVSLPEALFDLGDWAAGEDLFRTVNWCYSHDECMGFDTQGRVMGRIPKVIPEEKVFHSPCEGLYVLTDKCYQPPGYTFAPYPEKTKLGKTINKKRLDVGEAAAECESNSECIAITTEGYLLSQASEVVPQGAPSKNPHCRGFYVKPERCPQFVGFDFHQSRTLLEEIGGDGFIVSSLDYVAGKCKKADACVGFTTDGIILKGSLLESTVKAPLLPCEGVYATQGRCPVPRGYDFWALEGAPGHDLHVYQPGERTVEDLAKECSMRPDCKGFTHDGALKRHVLHRSKMWKEDKSSCKGVYVRKGVCHPGLGYVLTPHKNMKGKELTRISVVFGEKRMADACERDLKCVAYNTRGTLFSALGEFKEDKWWFSGPCSGTYVRPVCEDGYGLPACNNGVWTLDVGPDGPPGDLRGTVSGGWELHITTLEGTRVFKNPKPLRINVFDPHQSRSDVVVTGVTRAILDVKVKLVSLTTDSVFNISAYLHTPEYRRAPLFTAAHELLGHQDSFKGDFVVDDDLPEAEPVQVVDGEQGEKVVRLASAHRFLSLYKNKNCVLPVEGCQICDVGTWSAKGDNFCTPCEHQTITSTRGATSPDACDRCFVPSGYSFHPHEDAVDPNADWWGYGPVDVRRLMKSCAYSLDPETVCAGFNTRMTILRDVSTRKVDPEGFPGKCDGVYIKTECTQVEGYRFIPMYDSPGTINGSAVAWPDMTVMAQVCGNTPGCVAFNTHGYIMNSIADLSKSYLYGYCNGIYIKEDVCYEPPGYSFHPHEDINGNDMDVSALEKKAHQPQELFPAPPGFTGFGVDLNVLAQACNMAGDCVGFNTAGQAKSQAGPRVVDAVRYPGACEGVYVVKECTQVEGYTFFPKAYAVGGGMQHLEGSELTALGQECNKNQKKKKCVGFTSHGWLLNNLQHLRSDVNALHPVRCFGVYVREELAGELVIEEQPLGGVEGKGGEQRQQIRSGEQEQ